MDKKIKRTAVVMQEQLRLNKMNPVAEMLAYLLKQIADLERRNADLEELLRREEARP